MSWFNSLKVLCSVLLVLCAFTAGAQINPKNKQSVHFVYSNLHMTLSNNNIKNPFYKFTTDDLALPFKDEHFIVYGSQLTLSVFAVDTNTQFSRRHGSFFFDTIPKDQPTLNINFLQARYFRNGALLRDWKPVLDMTSFIDSSVTTKSTPIQYRRTYLVASDSLEVGDSIRIELRHGNDEPFLRLHANRQNAYNRPYMFAYQQDTSKSDEDFVQNQILWQSKREQANLFYLDWPRDGLGINNQQFSVNTRLAFTFRSDPLRDDSALLYRLFDGRTKDSSWKKTNGLILISSLQENTRYRLEVKFANGRGKRSSYTFYTPPQWYQTTSFKTIAASLALIILASIFFLLRALKAKRQRKLHSLEMQSLYAQMNPHFLFNALGSIQGLMNDNRIEQANLYLTEFASLLRASITQGRKELVPLDSDLKNIERYIQLERLRFDFQYQPEIDSKLITSGIEIPSMLSQPLIENAVKHGISAKGNDGILRYSIRHNQNDILISVVDNGHGFNPQDAYDGQGLKLTKERIRLFNRMHRGRTIHLQIDSKDGGTTATIRLQNWLE